MKTEKKYVENLPDAINLTGIEACKETITEVIRYSLHPTVNSFTTDDRLEIINIYQQLNDLLVNLRTKHGFSDSISQYYCP